MGSWFWSDFSLMKTLGGSACPLLPLFFHVQVVMCMYFSVCARACVLSVSLCTRSCFCFVKKQSLVSNGWHRSAFRQTGSREGSRSLVVTRAIALHAAAPPRSHFHPLFLCGWAEGCRLMKRVWTTKKSGSHLADTPAHLWPSESSHHDRPPPSSFSALSLPTSAHLPLGHTTSSGCPVTAKHSSPTVASNGNEEKEKERWGEPYFKWGYLVCDENMLFMQKASVVVGGRFGADLCSCPADQEPVFNSQAILYCTDYTVTRLRICWGVLLFYVKKIASRSLTLFGTLSFSLSRLLRSEDWSC